MFAAGEKITSNYELHLRPLRLPGNSVIYHRVTMGEASLKLRHRFLAIAGFPRAAIATFSLAPLRRFRD